MTIFVAAHTLHRRPDYWPDPEEFHPERHLEGGWNGSQVPTDAYRPFDKGPRNCIGQQLAMLEIRIILALTARRFDFQERYDEWYSTTKSKPKGDNELKAVHGEKAYQVFTVTAKPKDGLPVRVFDRLSNA